MGRNANAAEEAEGGAVGAVECDDVVQVGDLGVLVIQEDAVLLRRGGFVAGHGFHGGGEGLFVAAQSQFAR